MDLASNTDQVLQQSIKGLAGGGGGGGSSSSAESPVSSFIRSLPQLFRSLQIPHGSCPSSQPCSPCSGCPCCQLGSRSSEQGWKEPQTPGLGLGRCCSAIFSREGSARAGCAGAQTGRGERNRPQSPPRPSSSPRERKARDLGNIPSWSGWSGRVQPEDAAEPGTDPSPRSPGRLRARRFRDPAALKAKGLHGKHIQPAPLLRGWVC